MLDVQFWTLVKISHRNKNVYVKRLRHGLHILKILSKFVSLFVTVCNACLSFPSLFILVSLWFIIISLFFVCLNTLLFQVSFKNQLKPCLFCFGLHNSEVSIVNGNAYSAQCIMAKIGSSM